MYFIREYDVLEKSINQNFKSCADSSASLFVQRRDVMLMLFLPVAKKVAVVRKLVKK